MIERSIVRTFKFKGYGGKTICRKSGKQAYVGGEGGCVVCQGIQGDVSAPGTEIVRAHLLVIGYEGSNSNRAEIERR